MKKVLLFLGVCIAFICFPLGKTKAADMEGNEMKQENDGPIIIVLDPGHGGEAEGGIYNGILEKELNFKVANYAKEELEKYENVTVYLTRAEDYDLTLKDRAALAADYGADMLISMHFNKSESENMYGTEVWVSAFDDYYVRGRQFAEIEMEALKEMGLFSRGIKTRLYEDKTADYYGIIREPKELDILAVLIEHCFMDHENDFAYYNTDEALKRFGVLDATSIAKYFGLKSNSLGVDYSTYALPVVEKPNDIVFPDYTKPDVLTVEEKNIDMENGDLEFELTSSDPESPILYYCYSLDGGKTFTKMFSWEEGASSMPVKIHLEEAGMIQVVLRAQNQYDLFKDSEVMDYGMFYPPIEVTEEENYEDITFAPKEKEQEKEAPKVEVFLLGALGIATLVLVAAIVTKTVQSVQKKKRRNRKYDKNR